MAKEMKSLAKDTAIYGLSSIVGKFINWLLVPLYTYKLANPAEYGIVTNLFAWTAILLVILTYGMETGFFRFANKDPQNAKKTYGNTMISLAVTSLLFVVSIVFFHQPIANFLGYENTSEFIWMLGVIVAIDAFASIPFAYLRFQKRPIAFAGLKLLYIGLNILFNLFFLIVCPRLMKVAPDTISWFYNPGYGVGYIFISNLLATTIQTLFLIPTILQGRFEFDKQLLKQILNYSYPLLFLGIAGIANQNLDKILFPFLRDDALSQLGIYGAVGKIAMIIMMFTQAFRYAYEPYVFAKNKDSDSKTAYSMAMKYYVIFALLIFLGVTMYIDVIKYFIAPRYWIGLGILPIIMFSYIFQGIFFNLSIWYKLTDKNHYGAWFSVIGTMVILIGNILFVPKFSYWASVWSSFAGFFVIMLLSYFSGQKFMPINYNLKKIGFYMLLAIGLLVVSIYNKTPYDALNIAIKTVLLGIFVGVVIRKDLPLNELPFRKKKKS
ncbi:MAG: lipopolysaccharide biosynthesis protein [Paludibacteraceae bacterium]